MDAYIPVLMRAYIHAGGRVCVYIDTHAHTHTRTHTHTSTQTHACACTEQGIDVEQMHCRCRERPRLYSSARGRHCQWISRAGRRQLAAYPCLHAMLHARPSHTILHHLVAADVMSITSDVLLLIMTPEDGSSHSCPAAPNYGCHPQWRWTAVPMSSQLSWRHRLRVRRHAGPLAASLTHAVASGSWLKLLVGYKRRPR